MLNGELQAVQASSPHSSDKPELVSNFHQGIRTKSHLFVRHFDVGATLKAPSDGLGDGVPSSHQSSLNQAVRDEADQHANRNREESHDQSHCPHCRSLGRVAKNRKSSTAEKDNENLSATQEGTDPYHVRVSENPFKDVVVIVQTSVAERD